MSAARTDVYLSYADEDADRVRMLKFVLERQGWSTFFAAEKTYPTTHAADVLYAIRRDCRCVVVVWTENSVTSPWCLEEARDAKASGRLVQLRLDESLLPEEFLDWSVLKLDGWRGDPSDSRLDPLIATIGRRLARYPRGDTAPNDLDSPEGLVPENEPGAAETDLSPREHEDGGKSTQKIRWPSRALGRIAWGLALLVGAVGSGLFMYKNPRIWRLLSAPEIYNPDPQILGPEMVVIPGGEFLMGSPEGEPGRLPNEGSQHLVKIEAFALGRFEVTFDEFDEFAKDTRRELPFDEGWGRGKRPVTNVGWVDAQAYVEWLSKKTGKTYRLPSAEEWEYAARAGTTSSRYWGDDPSQACKFANVSDEKHGCRDGFPDQTAPVGSFEPNAFGLYDMLGNVLEWLDDCAELDKEPSSSNLDGPRVCTLREYMGGAFMDPPDQLRSAVRTSAYAGRYGSGFRVARSL